MAWSETPKGVFDSSRAKEIGDKLIAALATYGDEREALGEEKMRERCSVEIDDALSLIKSKRYVESLPDNGEDNGTPLKVVTYENVREIIVETITRLSHTE